MGLLDLFARQGASPSGGLLGGYDQNADTLLSLAAAFGKAGAPSTTRQSLFAGVPDALQGVAQRGQAAQLTALQRKMLEAQAAEAERKRIADEKAQAARGRLADQMRSRDDYAAGVAAMPGTTSPVQQQFLQTAKAGQPNSNDLLSTFMEAYPEQGAAAYGKMLLPDPKDNNPLVVPKDSRVIDPRTGKVLNEPSNKDGPFGGTGMDAQMMNMLLTGDPASPAYLAAYNQLGQPKQTFDPTTGLATTYNPDMSAYRRPVQQGGATVPPPGAAPFPAANGGKGGVSTQQVQPPKLTTAQENDLGSIRSQRATIAGAIDAVNGNHAAFGKVAGAKSKAPLGLAGDMLGPDAITARSLVLNNVSSIITERAGAAQSKQELQRIEGFLPSPFDSVPTILAKLKAFNAYLDEKETGIRGPQASGWTAKVVQ